MGLAAVVLVAAACALGVAPASASISGPCEATIGGQDVASLETGPTSEAVKVEKDGDVLVTMRANRPMTHMKITLEFAGRSWTVEDKDISSDAWAERVAVNDYATYGVGLYLIEGEATGAGFSCTGDGLVDVEGSPFGAVAGWAAIGMTALGVAGIVAATIGALRGTRGRFGAGLLGLLSGFIGGVGVGVLLQQFSVVYPTQSVAIAEILIGIAIGLVAPWVARLVGGSRGSGGTPRAATGSVDGASGM
jgi:hypothetical protein